MKINLWTNYRQRFFVFILLGILLLAQNACATPGKTNDNRSDQWAVAIERDGLPNLYKVSDALYRGAQPNAQGMKELKKLGIKTIVSFRTSLKDFKLINGYDFKFYHLPMNAFLPQKKKYQRFLEIVSDPKLQPVFVHCKHGADRTGAAVALYRIKLQNWTPEEAIDEMVNGGYHFHWLHSHLKGFIRKF